jgi:tight adherence protein C
MVLFIAAGLFFLFRVVFVTPPHKVTAVFESEKRRRRIKTGGSLLQPLTKQLSRIVWINSVRRNRLINELDRLNIRQTPEEYTADALVRTIIIVLVSFVFLPLGMPIMTPIIAMVGVMQFIRTRQEITDKIKELNSAIEDELPRMVSTLGYALAESRDLVRFFESYRSVAGDIFRADLNWLVFRMQTGNVQVALENWRDRINIPVLSQIVSLLISINDGVYQNSALIRLESDMRTMQREKLRREALARPRQFRPVFILLVVAVLAVLLIGIFNALLSNMNFFGA